MNNRYIQRFRMPGRQYIAGSPVVLAAGVLLEDTEQKRLVVQLKWKNISEKTIAKVAVYVKALDENDQELCKVKHTHRVGGARRGATFGHYNAIELPVSDAKSFELELIGTVATDAEVWRSNSNAWVTLPAFTELSLDEETQHFFNRHISNGKYEYYKTHDIWYCTCGAVNKTGETKCHKCRNLHEIVSKYADPVSLSAALQAKKDAEQKRQEDIEKFKAEAGAKLSAFKEAAEKKAIDVAASIELAKEEKAKAKAEKEAAEAAAAMAAAAVTAAAVTETVDTEVAHESAASETAASEAPAQAPVLQTVPVTSAPKKKNVKGTLRVIKVVAVLVIFALAFVLPKLMGGIGGSGVVPGRVNVNVTTDYDGETYQMVLKTDSDGLAYISLDDINEYFPEAEAFVMDGTPYLGDDLDYYLKTSSYMAELVGSQGEFAYGYGTFNCSPSWEDGIFYLFAFDDLTNICGYGIGRFENLGNGEYGFNITECDYDFHELYKGEELVFRGILNTVPEFGPEALYNDDVAYYIRWFTYSTNDVVYNNIQKYSLWSKFMSTNPDFLRDADTIEESLPERNDEYPVWSYYLLLDESHQIIGYSCYTTYDSSSAGTYTISTPYDTEMLTYPVPVEDQSLRFDVESLREFMPWADIESIELVYVPPVKTELEDYIRLSNRMNNLITYGEPGGASQSQSMHMNNGVYCLLIYGEGTKLTGYSVGVPDRNAQGTMDIYITLCDYDMEELYKKTLEEFEAAAFYETIGYIPYEQAIAMYEAGEIDYAMASWTMYGTNDKEIIYTSSAYYLWSKMMFPDLSNYAYSFDIIERNYDMAVLEEQDREVHLALLDSQYRPVGYTVLNPHFE